MIFEKGDFIQNRYQVDTILYSDNEGVIYSCKYRKGYKIVKQIFSSGGSRTEERDKLFSDRCSELKKLNHRNLVQIDDFFMEEDSCFAVMEQIKGKTLEDLYRKDYKGKVFPSDVLMQYVLKVCDGLKYMHSQNPPVLHGAIAPGTVITGGGGVVKLINYGLGHIISHGFNKGFDGFAAPEQESGKKEEISSDIYGIASLMYYLLSGKTYEAGTKKIESLMSFNPQVSKNLAELIAKCLSKKVSNRPDIGDFCRQLSKLYLSETVLKATRGFSMAVPEEDEEDETSFPEEEVIAEEKTIKEATEISAEKDGKEAVEISVQEKDTECSPGAEDEDSEKKKKKKKKKKKILTGELKEEAKENLKEEGREIEINIEEEREESEIIIEDIADKTEEPETDINTEEVKPEVISGDFESDSKEKKKKKKKKKKKEVFSDEIEEIKEDFDEIATDFEEQEEETADEVSEIIDAETESPEKKDSKPSLKTSALSMHLLSAIKQKEEESEEETEAVEEVAGKAEEEIKEEAKEAIKEEINKSAGVTPEQTGKDGKKLTRKSSIADFLRSKTGLTEEEYEVNKDLVMKGRRKSGLSEEFLASLKATSATSSIRTGGDAIKDVAFPLYKKPSSEPPFGVYEEVDMLKNNRYEVRELLHKDCYGGIYIVQDYDEHDDEKSTKILKDIQYKGTGPDIIKNLIDRFRNVCEKLTKLSHTGLTGIEDYFYTQTDDGAGVRFSLIMEHIEGMSFNEVAKTYYTEDAKSQMAAKTVFGVISKVYSALEYLHNNGVVYGDIRPSNLILTSDGNIKFLNYGLSNIFYGITDEVYPFKGVYGYVSPELRCLPEADFKSDIFSLGAVMYFMLTGSNPEEISYKFQPVRKFNPFLSLQVERFVQSLLSYTPSNRPEIGQIIRVMDSINFFEVVKEKPSKTDTGILKAPEKDVSREIHKPAGLDQVKSNISVFSETVKKIPVQLALIASGIVFAIIFMIVWTVGYIHSKSNFSDFLYVFSSETKELVALDQDSGKICKKLQLGECRSSIAFSLTRKELYILSSVGRIFVIDLPEFKIKKDILVDSTPYDIAILNDDKTLCVTSPASSELSLYSIEERKKLAGFVVGKFPTDLLLLPKENKLIVSDFKENKVYGVDINSNKILFDTDTGQGPRNMLYIPDRDIVYITNWMSNDISVIHVPTSKLAYTISVGINPSSIAVSPDYKKVYVTNQKSNSLSVIDVDTHKVTNEIKVDGEPTVILADSKYLYVGLKKSGNNKVALLNRLTFALEKDISLTGFPITLLLINK
ncbi:MAG: protein kinase [Candidatus Eremiobacterota bacterium]